MFLLLAFAVSASLPSLPQSIHGYKNPHTNHTRIHLFHTYICLYICLPNRFCPSANLTIKMSCSTFKHLVLESEAFINTVGRQWHSVTHPADNPSWEDRGYLQTMVFPRVVPVRHHSVQRLVFNHLTQPVSLTHSLPTPTTRFPVFLLPEEQNLRFEGKNQIYLQFILWTDCNVKHCFATWLETLHSCAPPSFPDLFQSTL